VEAVRAWYSYLRSRKLGPDPHEFGASDPPQLKGYRFAPPGACVGFLDAGVPVPGSAHTFTVTGWAWDRTGARLPVKIVLAFPTGDSTQTDDFVTPRPGVQKAVPEITVLNTGWRATIQAASGVRVRAYARLGDQQIACAPANEFIAP
jgi:hypothetical protein